MNHLIRSAAALLFAAMLQPAQSAELKLPRDGWVSWQVATIDDAPAWCCWNSWEKQGATRAACELDGRSSGYGTRDHETTDSMTVYARLNAGRVERLQSLATACAVETKTPIQPLGNVTPDDSARWLISQAKQDGADDRGHRSLQENALAALVVHRGDLALQALSGFARDGRAEVRKRSVFWLALLRGAEGADLTSSVMFNDAESEVRKHATFALSRSSQPRVVPDLIRLGNTDKVGHVRAQAWFWLAQKGPPEAEAAIGQALRQDADDHVREQAVFALSQLPDERATKALIATAQDRTLTREQRKRAVFWLSQSESPAAQAYLEKVLASNSR
jgi:HEAT repeat protein